MWKMCFTFRYSLGKICQNMGFLWLVFSGVQFCPYVAKTDTILSIYGNIRIRESSLYTILQSDKEEIRVSN